MTGVKTWGVGINITITAGAFSSYIIDHGTTFDCTEVGMPSAVVVTMCLETSSLLTTFEYSIVATVKSYEAGG